MADSKNTVSTGHSSKPWPPKAGWSAPQRLRTVVRAVYRKMCSGYFKDAWPSVGQVRPKAKPYNPEGRYWCKSWWRELEQSGPPWIVLRLLKSCRRGKVEAVQLSAEPRHEPGHPQALPGATACA